MLFPGANYFLHDVEENLAVRQLEAALDLQAPPESCHGFRENVDSQFFSSRLALDCNHLTLANPKVLQMMMQRRRTEQCYASHEACTRESQ